MEAEKQGLITKEKPLQGNDGRIKGNKIAIRQNMTTIEKSCILAEELGHHYTSHGIILDQSFTDNRKQERRARLWAYNKQIGLLGIIECFNRGCRSMHEMAEYLEVTEPFLKDTLESYRLKYGQYTTIDNYIIYFEPNLYVADMNF